MHDVSRLHTHPDVEAHMCLKHLNQGISILNLGGLPSGATEQEQVKGVQDSLHSGCGQNLSANLGWNQRLSFLPGLPVRESPNWQVEAHLYVGVQKVPCSGQQKLRPAQLEQGLCFLGCQLETDLLYREISTELVVEIVRSKEKHTSESLFQSCPDCCESQSQNYL